jgi:hypothetical protein
MVAGICLVRLPNSQIHRGRIEQGLQSG